MTTIKKICKWISSIAAKTAAVMLVFVFTLVPIGVLADADDAITLGSKDIGTRVTIEENGVPIEYIVIHHFGSQGHQYYYNARNTTFLLRNLPVTGTRRMNNVNRNDYSTSEMHEWLNTDFIGQFNDDIQNNMRQIRIPYRPGYGWSLQINAGRQGLPTRAFLLSHTEMGIFYYWDWEMTRMGITFGYFNEVLNDINQWWARVVIASSLNWLRTPYIYGQESTWGGFTGAYFIVGQTDNPDELFATSSTRIRPVIALPSNIILTPGGEISGEVLPGAEVPNNIADEIGAGMRTIVGQILGLMGVILPAALIIIGVVIAIRKGITLTRAFIR